MSHFTADAHAKEKAVTLGFSAVDYLAPATCDRPRRSTKDFSSLKNQVVFVGTTGYGAEFQKSINSLPIDYQENLLHMVETQVKNPGLWIVPQIIEDFVSSYPDKWQELCNYWRIYDTYEFSSVDKLAYFLEKDSAGRIRIEAVKIAKYSNITVFGDEGWKVVADYLNINFAGFADHYSELADIFCSAAININLTRPYAVGKVLPVRVFDILGSGGF